MDKTTKLPNFDMNMEDDQMVNHKKFPRCDEENSVYRHHIKIVIKIKQIMMTKEIKIILRFTMEKKGCD